MVSPASPPADARGYFRWPTLHGDTLAFVCEDDLYAVSASGGVPRRLTDAPGLVRRPRVSPDGEEGFPGACAAAVEGRL